MTAGAGQRGDPACPPRRSAVIVSALALLLLVVPVFAVSPPRVIPALLESGYGVKNVAVCLLAVALLAALGPLARRRLPAWLLWPALLLVAAYAIAALLAPYPDRAVREAVLRVSLVLVALAVARSDHPSRRLVCAGAATIAAGLAVLVLLEVLGVHLVAHVQARPAVTLLHRNNVAFHLAASLPLILALVLERRRPWHGWAATAAMVLVISALVATRSRTGWVAGAVGLVPVLAGASLAPALRRTVAIAVGLAILLLVAMPRGALEPLAERVTGAFDAEQAAWFERIAIYRDAFARLVDAPLVGEGPGTYVPRHRTFLQGRAVDHPHNDVLAAGHDAGLLAVLALAWLIFAVPALALTRGPRSAMSLALIGSLAAWAGLGLTNSPLSLAPSAAQFWLTFGLLARELARPDAVDHDRK
jgi:putative inorganic carbon (hco3(-)) transporter